MLTEEPIYTAISLTAQFSNKVDICSKQYK